MNCEINKMVKKGNNVKLQKSKIKIKYNAENFWKKIQEAVS